MMHQQEVQEFKEGVITQCPQMPSPKKPGVQFPHFLSSPRAARLLLRTAFLWTFVLALAASALGQTSQGFSGTVYDDTGAAIPTAQITIHNRTTGVDKTVAATGTGHFNISFLQPDVYDVKVSAPGFRPEDRTEITLQTDQVVTVDFHLKAGGVAETVTVSGSGDILDYSKADRGEVLEGISVTQLPLQAEDPFTLTQQVAGVTNTLAATSIGPFNQTAQSISIHGNQVQLNIDGMDNQSMTGSQNYEYDPPEGTLQEFRVNTAPYDAASGRSSGGAIDMTMKTGGQKYHGVLYELMRPGFIQANTGINDANIALHGPLPAYEVPAQHYHQFGFEVDGPVTVPKLWPGQHQTFFVLSWQHIDQLQNSTSSGSVPTQAMIGKGSTYPGAGDFTGLLKTNGALNDVLIYDPLSEATCTANNTDNGTYGSRNPHACRYAFGYGPGGTPGPQGNPTPTGAPINVIPASRMNPVATSIMSWFALPNQTPAPTSTNPYALNYFQNNPITNVYNNAILKLDKNVGNNDSFDFQIRGFISYGTSENTDPRTNVNPTHPGINWAGYGAHWNNHYREIQMSPGWTHTFSAHVVNSFKSMVSISDQTDNTGPPGAFDPANLGFPSSYAAFSSYFDRFPSTILSGYQTLGSISGLKRGDNKLDFVNQTTWTHGNHNMHFGGEFMPYQYAQRITNAAGGSINLNEGPGWSQEWDVATTGGATGFTNKGGQYSGNAIASLELGTLDSGNATTQPTNFYSLKYGAVWFQDDWKVRKDLTLNLGLRWDKPITGNIDRQNRQVYNFDSSDTNPINGLVNAALIPGGATLKGGITFAGVNGNPRSPWAEVYSEFGPRAGFAWVANPRTVVRGGMGLFYSETGNQYQPPQTGYSSTTTYTGSLDGGITPLLNLSNPFPVFQTPQGNCGGNQIQCLQTNAGQALSFYNPNFAFNPVLNSSLGIEQQFSRSDTLEISYAGSRSYNLAYSDDLNHISAAAQANCDPERGGKGSNCTSQTPGYVTNPFKGLAPFAGSGTYYTAATIQAINFSRPYPIFTSVTENNINGGKAWYNALEFTFTHRTSKGLTLHATYTYSKSMTANGYVDTVNRVLSRTINGADTPNRITVNGIYMLPIGRGRALFSNMNPVADVVLGGWQISSTLLYQSGLPFAISGYEIDPNANGGYLLPRKRFMGANSNAYWPNSQSGTANSYVQAFKPCVGTRDPNTGAVTLESYSVKAGCATANFIQLISGYSVTPNINYTGIRLQRIVEQDADISKVIRIHDRLNLQLRMDAFNVWNHMIQNSSGYDTSVGDANFGTYQMGTSGYGNYPPRQIQLVARLNF